MGIQFKIATVIILLCGSSAKAINTIALSDSGRTPKNVVYVEVNHHNIKNAANYTFTDTGRPFFDIAIIFAANINYSAAKQKAVLYCNPNVREVLNRKNDYVKHLQSKGIKVLLALLGNHHGAGFTNFKTRDAARDFAQQVADTVNNNNLDGIDIDDEWVDYKPQWPRNNNSLVWLVSELRKLMPGKIISLYDMDMPDAMKQGTEGNVSDYVNYVWQPYYGKFDPPVYPGLSKSKLSPAAIDVTQSATGVYEDFARRTKAGGYGWMMYYNLASKNISAELSAAAKILYNTGVRCTAPAGLAWTSKGDTDADWEKACGLK